MSEPMVIVSENDLFALRNAAAVWLWDHPQDPNSKQVYESLMNTNGVFGYPEMETK